MQSIRLSGTLRSIKINMQSIRLSGTPRSGKERKKKRNTEARFNFNF